eukprot:Rhum_TRINITY_DN14797_c4_g3::Rhum_TRINITY_DN14797_c4_g3_i1::g.117079::m.117079
MYVAQRAAEAAASSSASSSSPCALPAPPPPPATLRTACSSSSTTGGESTPASSTSSVAKRSRASSPPSASAAATNAHASRSSKTASTVRPAPSPTSERITTSIQKKNAPRERHPHLTRTLTSPLPTALWTTVTTKIQQPVTGHDAVRYGERGEGEEGEWWDANAHERECLIHSESPGAGGCGGDATPKRARVFVREEGAGRRKQAGNTPAGFLPPSPPPDTTTRSLRSPKPGAAGPTNLRSGVDKRVYLPLVSLRCMSCAASLCILCGPTTPSSRVVQKVRGTTTTHAGSGGTCGGDCGRCHRLPQRRILLLLLLQERVQVLLTRLRLSERRRRGGRLRCEVQGQTRNARRRRLGRRRVRPQVEDEPAAAEGQCHYLRAGACTAVRGAHPRRVYGVGAQTRGEPPEDIAPTLRLQAGVGVPCFAQLLVPQLHIVVLAAQIAVAEQKRRRHRLRRRFRAGSRAVL